MQNLLTKKHKTFRKVVKDSWHGWIFVLPLVIGIGVFTLYPLIQSLIYSFYRYDGLFVYDFIGLQNFVTMFTTDRAESFKVFGNTFLYALISVPLNLCLSYLLAVAVNQKIKGVIAYRVMFYLPVVIPAVVSGVIWSQLFDKNYGLFNDVITKFGGDPFPFFTDKNTAKIGRASCRERV